jgi:EAL domain-containing protein (putative c-di-GMP-specific phosphodiesterase class I)
MWVLRGGLARAKRLRNGNHQIRVSINVSAKQLGRPNFVQCVRSVISGAGVDPHMIELELTESIALEDPQGATETLRELRQIGVHLSIDDFGTGYSSLAYLTRLPV